MQSWRHGWGMPLDVRRVEEMERKGGWSEQVNAQQAVLVRVAGPSSACRCGAGREGEGGLAGGTQGSWGSAGTGSHRRQSPRQKEGPRMQATQEA